MCAHWYPSVLLDHCSRRWYTCSRNRGVKTSLSARQSRTGRERRMQVQRAYKTELDLNDRQVTACRQHAGAARWAHNWGLQVKQERYRASTKSPNAIDLHRELNALKKTAVPWMYARLQVCATGSPVEPGCGVPAVLPALCPQEAGEVDRQARVSPVQDQEEGIGSFRLTGRIVVSEKAIVLPRLGRLRLKEREYLPTEGCRSSRPR